jgi:DNA-binding transcriptional MerR regulator
MATVAGIKIKIKKPKFDPKFMDEKHTGAEPLWDHDRAVCFSDEEFDHHLRTSMNYYNYYYSQKDLVKHVVKWCQENAEFTKEEITAYLRGNPENTPMTCCSVVKAIERGMPAKERHKEFIIKCVREAIEKGGTSAKIVRAEAKVAANAKTPVQLSIQDRLAEKSSEIIGEIEGEVDNVFSGKASTMKFYDFLTIKKVAHAQVGKIRAVFERQRDELALALEGTDPQLKEAYSYLKKADVSRIAAFYGKLFSDFDSYVQVKKTTKKARAPRAVSKDKIIAKLKFQKDSKELKVASINPLDILEATALWVYNTKTRKLGKYVADAHSGTLGIKGTSIVGYDETKSVAKTLRKPDEQLKELMKSGKVALRTFLKDIKAVETRLNGRVSAEILLLKVER